MLYLLWAQVAGTVFLGLVGLWLANNYRRQVRVKFAERQLDAYSLLWKITSPARSARATPFGRKERQELHDDMLKWYHEDGNGIFVSVPTRNLYLAYMTNLVCPLGKIKPDVLARELAESPEADAELRRGCVSNRQAILLRNQLKSDLLLHVGFVGHYNTLRPDDRAFLKSCGHSPRRRPWRRRFSWPQGHADLTPCICGKCG